METIHWISLAKIGSLCLMVVIVLALKDFLSPELSIIFCQQQQSIYIRVNHQDILANLAKGKTTLTCLAAHMPFFDRQIEWLILTRPTKETLNSLPSIQEHYLIKNIIAPKDYEFNTELSSLTTHKTQLKLISKAEKVTIGNNILNICPQYTQPASFDFVFNYHNIFLLNYYSNWKSFILSERNKKVPISLSYVAKFGLQQAEMPKLHLLAEHTLIVLPFSQQISGNKYLVLKKALMNKVVLLRKNYDTDVKFAKNELEIN